nr:hypothetical protein [Endozoicomonas sp. SESOKO3]
MADFFGAEPERQKVRNDGQFRFFLMSPMGVPCRLELVAGIAALLGHLVECCKGTDVVNRLFVYFDSLKLDKSRAMVPR